MLNNSNKDNIVQCAVNILSANVRGLNNKRSRISVFEWAKKQKADIILLQETYSSMQTEHLWKQEWGGSAFFKGYATRERKIAREKS